MVGGEQTAMSCIRFRFKSDLEFGQIRFDGLQISVSDLREKIMLQKKLGTSNEFTLEIMDAQTKKGMCNSKNAITSHSFILPRVSSVCIIECSCLLVELLFQCGLFVFSFLLTCAVFTDDTEMVPRNTSVVVKRVPKPQQSKVLKT